MGPGLPCSALMRPWPLGHPGGFLSPQPGAASLPCDRPRPIAHRICSEDIECSGLTIPKAVQYLSSQDEKYQAIGAYYIQHTCFQDESAKQQVTAYLPPPEAGAGTGPVSLSPFGRVGRAVAIAPLRPAWPPGARSLLGIA